MENENEKEKVKAPATAPPAKPRKPTAEELLAPFREPLTSEDIRRAIERVQRRESLGGLEAGWPED
jgi:hypothetical protein